VAGRGVGRALAFPRLNYTLLEESYFALLMCAEDGINKSLISSSDSYIIYV
jgi:hypothetical protein